VHKKLTYFQDFSEIFGFCFSAAQKSAIIAQFFSQVDNSGLWKCNICSKCISKSNSVGTLTHHVAAQHEDSFVAACKTVEASSRSKQSTLKFLPNGQRLAQSVFDWIELILNVDVPSNRIEDPTLLKFVRCEPLSKKTIMRYPDELCGVVRNKIARTLPNTFGLCFDDWDAGDGTKICGIFVCYSGDRARLISLNPLVEGFSTGDHVLHIENVL
jgi:hypothetical protein